MSLIRFEDHIQGPPPNLVHGGYVAGTVAKEIGPIASVRLKAPTPRLTDLDIIKNDSSVHLQLNGQDTVIAEPADANDLPEVPEVFLNCSTEAAESASSGYEEFRNGAHPGCYACKNQETHKRLAFTFGPLIAAPEGYIAGLWRPPEWVANEEGNIDFENLWAAMDCPGWHAWRAKTPGFPLCFLGTMTAEIKFLPKASEPLTICSWPIEGGTGRKCYSGVALLNAQGECVARAHQIWIKIA